MPSHPDPPYAAPADREEYVLAEVVPTDTAEVPPHQIPVMPVVLFLASLASTFYVGGWSYAIPVMGILLCHELGHYIQARRYHVPASLPYFIPFPFSPIGTMGAVIGMRGHIGDRKALYDIGISGPLAGLVPTLICCVVGLSWSVVVDKPGPSSEPMLGAPLLFRWILLWFFPDLSPGQLIDIHPLAFAGWVGMFITALNLIPISQLDGGHVLYALLREKSHAVAWTLVAAAFAFVIVSGHYEWSLMLMLILLIGPSHPPTADDTVPLGTGRIILGWLTLAFVVIGFTPTPFIR